MTAVDFEPLTVEVISRYLANPAPFGEYVRQSSERAEATRRTIETSQPPGPTRDELVARAKAKGLVR